jgi:hypothetical protein
MRDPRSSIVEALMPFCCFYNDRRRLSGRKVSNLGLSKNRWWRKFFLYRPLKPGPA